MTQKVTNDQMKVAMENAYQRIAALEYQVALLYTALKLTMPTMQPQPRAVSGAQRTETGMGPILDDQSSFL